MLGEDYANMARPDKVWCLVNGNSGHEVDAEVLSEDSEYRQDIQELIRAKTSVAKLLVDHYGEGEENAEEVRNIQIPYVDSLTDDRQQEVEAVNEMLDSAKHTESLLIAGRDAVSAYQEALGYEMKDNNPNTTSLQEDSQNFTGAYERFEELAEYAHNKGDSDMAKALDLSRNNASREEIRSFAENSRWDVDPENVDAIDLRIWSRDQLSGAPFTSYPTPEEVLNDNYQGDTIENSWDLLIKN